MNWFYADNGEQRGPISQAEFDALVASGAINDATLVWREGLPAWSPWGTVRGDSGDKSVLPPFNAPAAQRLPPGRVLCAECGREFAEEDTLGFGQRRVCAACKPVFLQRLTEGAALSTRGGREASLEEVATREYPLGVGRAWDRAIAVFKLDPWMLMLALLVMTLVLASAGFVGMIANVLTLPLFAAAGSGLVVGIIGNVISTVVSSLVGLFVTGQLIAGRYLVFLLRLRGEPVNLAAAFRGFGPRYWQLTLCQFVQTLVSMGFALLLVAGLGTTVFLGARSTSTAASTPTFLTIAAMLLGGLLAMVGVVLMFYYLVSWFFALPLILDKGLDCKAALKLSRQVVNRHPWGFSWLLLVASTFGMLGAVLCGVGMLLTGTIAYLMLASVYEDMFGDLAPQQRA